MRITSSRQRLAVMGVDLWVARQAQVVTAPSQIWRDDDVSAVAPPQPQNHSFANAMLQVDLANHATAQSLVGNDVVKSLQPNALSTQTKAQSRAVLQANDQTSLKASHSVAAANIFLDANANLTVAAKIQSNGVAAHSSMILPADNHEQWSLEVCVLEHVILLLNAGQLSREQRTLWQNIVTGLNGQFVQISWPSMFKDWQDPRGQEFYLSGFLAAYAKQKMRLLLGDFPRLHDQLAAQRMPSLSEMLTQPLLKQRLWTQIRECNTFANSIT